jgi:Alternative complex III, ActD subunit
MSKHLHFSFDGPNRARSAVRELERAGVARSRVTVMSGEPFLEIDDPLAAAHPSHIGLFSLAGAVVGALAGFSLVYFSSRSYPLVTSAMPIVPPMTTGIIVYETTAIGAILGAVLRMLWETALPGWKNLRDDYDAAMEDGGIIVSAETNSDDENKLRSILAAEGGREMA